jgi:hypothetical protein
VLSALPDWNLQQWLVFVLGTVGIIWYYICLFGIGWNPPDPRPNAFRDFMSLSLTTIAVSLATFVGALLGLKTVVQKTVAAQAAATITAPGVAKAFEHLEMTTTLQWIAASLYVVSLLLAIIMWRRNGNATDPAVSNLAKSLLGLIAGALSITFSIGS